MELGLTILGILLAAVSLIALWPSLTVTPNAPINPMQPFSVPFQITNASYLPLKDARVYFYAHRVRVGGIVATSNLMTNQNWRADYLGRGESITIIARFIQAPILPAEADIVIVVDYKMWGMPFWQLRHFVRFVGNFGVNWQWLQQPSKEVQAAAEEMIDR